ncbi:SWF or SNF family helicase [Streptomyces diastatochromogenes]|uniref:SWF or SNF family helicase n=1 Tax=Streptomyces diastatochromogenes TaxID=42236 RepID=A0A233S939_STRDA|nr:SWF or SNF family helicase [Streptomyces diastatochromogenes]OXY92102.1 SWF or SNF family helicase [Streptomyces diastatochromogenes]
MNHYADCTDFTDEPDRGLERTFAALPPARGRGFAQTWWGRAWLGALEETALDSAAVKAGRRLARGGGVGAVTVRPGRVTAVVRDPRGSAHRADVLVPELSEEQWVGFLDLAVEQAGHLAALLDGELPSHLIEDAAIRGIELLPGLGDLEPECDCDAWDHCGHTAALCHQVAGLLDEDPFVLLLMRGRAQSAFLHELHLRSAASPDESAAAEGVDAAESVDAAEAWAAADILPPLPALPGLPEIPGEPPSFDAETAPVPGIDPVALRYLAARTAVEAHRMLRQSLSGEPDTELTAAQDAVRLADGAAPGAVADRLAEEAGRGREGLATAVRAWRVGGAAALAVLDEEWQVEDVALARARAALEAAWEEDEQPSFRPVGNRWTVAAEGVQLRLGREGRWWPYREEGGRWVPAGGADRDPATALAAARLGPEDQSYAGT